MSLYSLIKKKGIDHITPKSDYPTLFYTDYESGIIIIIKFYNPAGIPGSRDWRFLNPGSRDLKFPPGIANPTAHRIVWVTETNVQELIYTWALLRATDNATVY